MYQICILYSELKKQPFVVIKFALSIRDDSGCPANVLFFHSAKHPRRASSQLIHTARNNTYIGRENASTKKCDKNVFPTTRGNQPNMLAAEIPATAQGAKCGLCKQPAFHTERDIEIENRERDTERERVCVY